MIDRAVSTMKWIALLLAFGVIGAWVGAEPAAFNDFMAG
jgi:hypothetical protein